MYIWYILCSDAKGLTYHLLRNIDQGRVLAHMSGSPLSQLRDFVSSWVSQGTVGCSNAALLRLVIFGSCSHWVTPESKAWKTLVRQMHVL